MPDGTTSDVMFLAELSPENMDTIAAILDAPSEQFADDATATDSKHCIPMHRMLGGVRAPTGLT